MLLRKRIIIIIIIIFPQVYSSTRTDEDVDAGGFRSEIPSVSRQGTNKSDEGEGNEEKSRASRAERSCLTRALRGTRSNINHACARESVGPSANRETRA